MSVTRMFQTGTIGSLRIKNRLVMPAMATNFASAHGEPTARMISYYAARARGGVGLIVVENASIDEPAGGNGTVQLRIDQDRYVPGLSALAQAVQAHGAAAAIQINHAGAVAKQQLTGMPPVAPSGVGWTEASPRPVPLSLDEIQALIARYAAAAVRAKRSGFDAVEIHGAHGYLIAQFLSPLTNRRIDAYGGSMQKRWRFALEVVRAVREAVGQEYPILFRLSADEFMPGGRGLEESIELSQALVASGIDALNVTAGTSANPETQLEPMSYEEGWRLYLAAAIKEKLPVPVVAVGVFRYPNIVEGALEQGHADFVAIGRGLIADPQWPNKVRSGREETIRHCISCNRCVRRRVFDDLPIGCSVNPAVGFEDESCPSMPDRKRIVVVGGGPGGLLAAATAAQLGAEVMLFERRDVLGGQLHYAAMPPHKEKIKWLIDDLVATLPTAVQVRLDIDVTADEIRAQHPDAVILSTGAIPGELKVPIDARASVRTAEAVLASTESLEGMAVTVIGAGMVGCETALACAMRGAQVLLLEALADAGQDCEPISRAVLLRHLEQENVRILTGTQVLKITSDAVIVKTGGIKTSIPATHVVLAVGARPYDPLSDELKAETFPLFVIGDARQPRGIAEAVFEGWRAARHVAICSPHKRTGEEELCNEFYE